MHWKIYDKELALHKTKSGLKRVLNIKGGKNINSNTEVRYLPNNSIYLPKNSIDRFYALELRWIYDQEEGGRSSFRLEGLYANSDHVRYVTEKELDSKSEPILKKMLGGLSKLVQEEEHTCPKPEVVKMVKFLISSIINGRKRELESRLREYENEK